MEFKTGKDGVLLNKALFNITHGLYVLTAEKDGKMNGQCLDALMQVTNNPPRIAMGVGQRTLTHEMIMATGKFTISCLDKSDPKVFETVKHFGYQSGRMVDKFALFPFDTGENGLPIIKAAKAFFECLVVREMTVDLGTHTLIVGKVERAGAREDGELLTYNEYRVLRVSNLKSQI